MTDTDSEILALLDAGNVGALAAALADVLQAAGRQVDTFGQASVHIVTDKVVVPNPAREP